MTEGRRVSANDVFAKKRQEMIDYNASPEGQAAWASALEKMDSELRTQSIVTEGQEAGIAGLEISACPYPADTTESRLWIYGYENPPVEDDEDDGAEDDENRDDEEGEL